MPRQVLRGRARELAVASDLLRRAGGDGLGSTLLVGGEPGIGKTAFLREVHDRARDLGFAVGFGKADEVSQIAAGAPVLLALRSGSTPLLSDEEFSGLAQLYEQPLWLVEAIADLLDHHAQRRPLMLVVDDLQWADRLSRFAVRVLAGRLSSSPVVILAASRGGPTEVFADFASVRSFDGAVVDEVELSPLTDDEVVAVATDLLGRAPFGRGREWLQMVGGSPLLAVQLVEGLALDAAMGRPGTVLPTSFGAALRTRMSQLDEVAVAGLQLAAVWGRPLDVADAAQMLDVDPARLLRSMGSAVALGLVVQPPDPIDFRHDLVRGVVHDDLSEASRIRWHGTCAAFLVATGRPAIDAAPHARVALGRGDRTAIGIVRRAALECVDALPQTAAALSLEAFRAVPRGWPERFDVGVECAEVLTRAQRGAEAVQVIDALLDGLTDPGSRARLQVLAARALWLAGAADELARRAEHELSTSVVDGALRARLEASRSLALSRVGTARAASLAATAALERGGELEDAETEALALQALGEVAKNEGRHLASYEIFHRLRTSPLPAFLADEITSLQFLDRFDEAQRLLERVARGAGRHTTADLPSLMCAQLWQDFKLAHFDAAVADAQLLLDVGDELGTFVHRLDARVVMSTVAVVHGDVARARELVAAAEVELSAHDAVQAPGLVLAKARIAAAELDVDEGVRLLKPLLTSEATSHAYWPRLLDQMRLGAGIAIAAGDLAFADEVVLRAAAAARRNPGIASLAGVALQVRGFVADDPEVLGSAVALLRRSPRPFMLAAALTDLGAALGRVGRRTEARPVLVEAASIFDGLRAPAAGAQVQALLQEVGAPVHPPRRAADRPVAGWGALTDAEVVVARLVVDGLTNRSAAEQLGVSVNTVATHVRSIFAKMAVRSRVQLLNAMRAEGAIP
jgi:DNA-binding CsgD family transcriptional regulator/tetratricopeptide (TPR) repeat protein